MLPTAPNFQPITFKPTFLAFLLIILHIKLIFFHKTLKILIIYYVIRHYFIKIKIGFIIIYKLKT